MTIIKLKNKKITTINSIAVTSQFLYVLHLLNHRQGFGNSVTGKMNGWGAMVFWKTTSDFSESQPTHLISLHVRPTQVCGQRLELLLNSLLVSCIV